MREDVIFFCCTFGVVEMARVTGIGGIFLKARDPKALAQWYAQHLGVALTDYGGINFLWSDEVPEKTGMTAWSLFPDDTKYFGPGSQTAMVNYRVDDMDGMLAQLSAAGVWIDPQPGRLRLRTLRLDRRSRGQPHRALAASAHDGRGPRSLHRLKVSAPNSTGGGPVNMRFMNQFNPGRADVGRIEVITGPMFSGKSEELIRRLKRARIARQRVACFKPDIDLRYHRTSIASHSLQTHEAETVANVELLRESLYPQLHEVEVVGLDEAQFFDDSIIPFAVELVHVGKRVILAGLDTTFNAEPFGPIPALMAIADEVTKLSAVCMVCGSPAIHTQRLTSSQELVVVGAAGMYEARCRACFQPYVDENASEQLELPAIQQL